MKKKILVGLVYLAAAFFTLVMVCAALASCRSPKDAAANIIVSTGSVVDLLHHANVEAFDKTVHQLALDAENLEHFDAQFVEASKQFEERAKSIADLSDALLRAATLLDHSTDQGASVNILPSLQVVLQTVRATVGILTHGSGLLPALPVPPELDTVLMTIQSMITRLSLDSSTTSSTLDGGVPDGQ